MRQLDSNFSFFDAGGGTGRWSIKVLENFPESSGVIYDLSVEMLEEARKKIVARKGLEKKLKMVIGNLENLQLGSFQKFDLVFCFHNVIGFVESPSVLMRNLKNVTKKDGYIIVMFPNGYHATFFNISNNNIKLAKESLSGFGKFTENMPYMNMFSVIDVRKCAEDTGLSIETIVGFPKINPYVEESILNVLFCKRNISYIKENKNGCSNSFLEWNQENQKIKRQTKDSSKWIWELNNNQYCHEFKGILMGGCLNTFDDISKTYLWPSHELWKNSILFLDISDNTAPSLVEKYLKNNIECIKYTNAVLVGRTILCEQNIKYGKMYVEIIRNLIAKHNEKNIPIISNMDFGHTEPVTILPFGINCRVDCDKRKILFLEMPVVR